MADTKRPGKPKQTTRTRAWNEANLDRLYITVPQGRKKDIEAHVKPHKDTVNGLINRLLRNELGMSEEEWKSKSGKP